MFSKRIATYYPPKPYFFAHFWHPIKIITRQKYLFLPSLYMMMGGVPAYLNAVERGKSVAQNIETICFSKDGALAGEFDNLYAALFNTPEKHIQVIQALARKNTGLTRSGILNTGKLLTGGNITNVLNELVESGFIQRTLPFGKKEKDSLYRLSDSFSLFYYKKSATDWRRTIYRLIMARIRNVLRTRRPDRFAPGPGRSLYQYLRSKIQHPTLHYR
jgi:hypothetical protein